MVSLTLSKKINTVFTKATLLCLLIYLVHLTTLFVVVVG